MFKETLKQKQMSVTLKVMLLVLAVAMVVLLQCAVLVLNRNFHVPALEYVAYLILISGAAWFFFRKMVSFSYSIIDSDIIIDKAVGSRSRCVEDIYFEEVIEMGTSIKGDYKDMKTRRFSIQNSAKEAYYIVYKRKEKIHAIMLHPTKKFIECLEKRYKCFLDNENAIKES